MLFLLIMDNRLKSLLSVTILLLLIFSTGCENGSGNVAGTATSASVAQPVTATTNTDTGAVAGIKLDPNLQSSTGIPSPEEIKVLVALQGRVPYPVIVPTYLPGANYILDRDLIGSGGPAPRDPVGYYSYRYYDPDNPERKLTFNQNQTNSKALQGYFLTDVIINGTSFQVYWISATENLPAGGPVRKDQIVDAIAFVVIWKGEFVDAAGQGRNLFYSLTSGTTSGNSWYQMRSLLASLKPLAQVGQ
ncbi:hypothetical protein BMS3Abin01_00626 [bacterium BMS3Abin01]|nr:hypothetical protein BMS3Abin01_00626 [bacterium BMS3Abin01]